LPLTTVGLSGIVHQTMTANREEGTIAVRKEMLVMKLSEAVDYYLSTCKTEGL